MEGKSIRYYEFSGFIVYASNASEDNLQLQCAEVEAFLTEHFDDLIRIDDTDNCEIDFAYVCRLGTGEGGNMISIQCDHIPSSLVRLCGLLSLGISFTLFPPR